MCQDIGYRIGKFFISKKDDLIRNNYRDENDLLSFLKFSENLNLVQDTLSENALFGKGRLASDFKLSNDDEMIIEVKYIRVTELANGQKQYNEGEIKNALSQIMEQSFCKQARKAILVIIDAGRASSRNWSDQEKQFISMFSNNPLNINLFVVRVKITSSDCSCEFI